MLYSMKNMAMNNYWGNKQAKIDSYQWEVDTIKYQLCKQMEETELFG